MYKDIKFILLKINMNTLKKKCTFKLYNHIKTNSITKYKIEKIIKIENQRK
jgi:hypothetical protein